MEGGGAGAFGMEVVSVKESVTLCIRSKLSTYVTLCIRSKLRMSHYASVLN